MAKKGIVGQPLTPQVISEFTDFQGLPPPDNIFKPEGDWTQTYRIFTCHGYTHRKNLTRGFLKIQRENKASGDQIHFRIKQKIVNSEGRVQKIDADVRAKNDNLATLLHWSVESRFFNSAGNKIPDLSMSEEYDIETYREVVSEESSVFKPTGPITSDFTLFEAIPRLPFSTEANPSFHVVEGLTLFKRNHYLVYRGEDSLKTEKQDATLQWFHQIGEGVLPYEYWVDNHRRLIAATTLSRAYLLDPQAEQKTAEHLAGEIEEFQEEQAEFREKYNPKRE